MDDCIKTVLIISIFDFIMMLSFSILIIDYLYAKSKILAGLLVPFLSLMNATYFRSELEKGEEACNETSG